VSRFILQKRFPRIFWNPMKNKWSPRFESIDLHQNVCFDVQTFSDEWEVTNKWSDFSDEWEVTLGWVTFQEVSRKVCEWGESILKSLALVCGINHWFWKQVELIFEVLETNKNVEWSDTMWSIVECKPSRSRQSRMLHYPSIIKKSSQASPEYSLSLCKLYQVFFQKIIFMLHPSII